MADLLMRAFQEHPMFNNISMTDCNALMGCLGCTEKVYKKDQIISPPDSSMKQLGLVIRGRVHTVKEDVWGRRTFLSYTNDDGIFGEVLGDKAYQERGIHFRAAEPTVVLYLPIDKILHPCKNACPFHHQLSRNLFAMMCRKHIALTEKIEITSRPSLREKILAYLSMEAQKSGSLTITLPFNRTEMADFLCTNRSALSRELSNMKKDGILDYDQKVFHLYTVSQEQ